MRRHRCWPRSPMNSSRHSSERPRVLLLGAGGQIGSAIRALHTSTVEVIGADRRVLDLADHAAIARVIREIRPALIINAAGWTAVDLAESRADAAVALNL